MSVTQPGSHVDRCSFGLVCRLSQECGRDTRGQTITRESESKGESVNRIRLLLDRLSTVRVAPLWPESITGESDDAKREAEQAVLGQKAEPGQGIEMGKATEDEEIDIYFKSG